MISTVSQMARVNNHERPHHEQKQRRDDDQKDFLFIELLKEKLRNEGVKCD